MTTKMNSGTNFIEVDDLPDKQVSTIIAVVENLKEKYNLNDWDFQSVETTQHPDKSYELTIRLARNPEWYFRWRVKNNDDIPITMQPNPNGNTPHTSPYKIPNHGNVSLKDLLKGASEGYYGFVLQKEDNLKKLKGMFFGRKEYYADIQWEDISEEDKNEYHRDFSIEERTDLRKLLFAWNEGVQADQEVQPNAKQTANKVHGMLQTELEKSNSVLEFMYRTDNAIKALTRRFSLKSVGHYIVNSGIAVTFNTALFTAWSAIATGGGITGATIGLLAYAGISLGDKAFKKESQL